MKVTDLNFWELIENLNHPIFGILWQYVLNHKYYIITPILTLFLVISFILGQKSANRAKYFSQKLKKATRSIEKIKLATAKYERYEIWMKYIRRGYFFLIASTIAFLVMDFFLMDSVFRKKIMKFKNIDDSFHISTSIKIGVVGLIVLVYYSFGWISKLMKKNRDKLSARIKGERKIVSDMIIKILGSFGNKFKEQLKEFLIEWKENKLQILERNHELLKNELFHEETNMEKAQSIRDLYEIVMEDITKSYWCDDCKAQITQHRKAPMNLTTTPEKGKPMTPLATKTPPRRNNTITSQEDSNDEEEKELTGSQGKTKALSDSKKKFLVLDLSSQAVLRDEVNCDNNCMRKLFQMVIEMGKFFEENNQLFE